MTGPLLRVTCEACGGEFARRRDGSPYHHTCKDGVTPPAIAKRVRCARCGTFLSRQGGAVRCGKCLTVWEAER